MPVFEDYLLYHNPNTMGTDFQDIARSGTVATNKKGTAEKAMENRGVIWCVGRDLEDNRYYLYQRLVEPITYPGDAAFKIILKGKPTFPDGFVRDITDEPYFPKVKKLVSLGLQLLTDTEVREAFKVIYAQAQ